MIEKWKKELDINKYVEAVLMDLSKAFDYIPNESFKKNGCVWF